MPLSEQQDWDEERLARLALNVFPGFGSASLRHIAERFSSYRDAWLAKASDWHDAGFYERFYTKWLAWRRSYDPMTTIALLRSQNINILFLDDDAYPLSLRSSSDPPDILFVRGVLSSAPAVAVVGTRRMTPYGKQCAEQIVEDLIGYGFCIVSGLALGVDQIAHETTLRLHGPTVAFLGCGSDDETLALTPNASLGKRLFENGGAVVSEFSPGTPPFKSHFPMRNRLIASFSAATLVIEAAEKSGSLITAKLALEENREVLAVPGPIWSSQSKGTNTLLKLGAKVCTSGKDVLDALAMDRPDLVAQARSALPLNPDEERLVSLLDEPRHADELARLSGWPSGTVSGLLCVLELKGMAKPIGGQMWAATKRKP